MLEVIVGMISGAVGGLVALVILYWLQQKDTVGPSQGSPTEGTVGIARGLRKRPDNSKARRYNDPRYRAQKNREIIEKAPGG